jgi:hypothetical protein
VRIIAQDVPQHGNAASQGILAYKGVRPDGAENFVLRNDAPGLSCQLKQNAHDLGFDSAAGIALGQLIEFWFYDPVRHLERRFVIRLAHGLPDKQRRINSLISNRKTSAIHPSSLVVFAIFGANFLERF